jgi:(4-alkanoyl-5-oxo-2,5-dihydrofuran-3-yl)methyl phosphate reductase
MGDPAGVPAPARASSRLISYQEVEMILVAGATGTVGREVVAQLLAAGERVRAMTRDPSRAKLDAKVEVVAADLDQPETLEKALAGVDRVFALSAGPELGVHDANLARAAKKAGARHLVKLSVLGAGGEARNVIVLWHEAGEKAIQESGLAWTFVRPGMFMSNALNWARTIKSQGKVFANYREGKVPPIHPRDIAAVAVAALTSGGHEGKSYPLTGGEALSMNEQVQILSEVVGRPIELVPISDDAARDGMLKAGMPPLLVDAIVEIGGSVRSGKASEVLPTVEQVLGRKPLTWTDWARENAAAFR